MLLILLAIYLGLNVAATERAIRFISRLAPVGLTATLIAGLRVAIDPARLRKYAERAGLDDEGTSKLMVAYIGLIGVITVALVGLLAAYLGFGI